MNIEDLSPEEQRELSNKLAYAMRGRAFVPNDEHLALWEAITVVLKSASASGKNRPGRGGLISFVEKYGLNKYRQRCDMMELLLDEALPRDARRRGVKEAIRQISLRCLADYLDARNVSLSPTSLLNTFDRLRWTVDCAFPGYIECKILHRIVQIAA